MDGLCGKQSTVKSLSALRLRGFAFRTLHVDSANSESMELHSTCTDKRLQWTFSVLIMTTDDIVKLPTTVEISFKFNGEDNEH